MNQVGSDDKRSIRDFFSKIKATFDLFCISIEEYCFCQTTHSVDSKDVMFEVKEREKKNRSIFKHLMKHIPECKNEERCSISVTNTRQEEKQESTECERLFIPSFDCRQR